MAFAAPEGRGQGLRLRKRSAEAEADPALLYNSYGYGPWYARPCGNYYGKRSAEAEPEAATSPEADPTVKTAASLKGFLKVPEAKRNGRYGYPGYGYYNCPWYYYGYGCGSWWGKK